ncbi:hybrid sensor histidine kinase/response regulator [Iningainema tapete]|uniref:histidine kinase n=1 Tax=Iningainema tapete BLCC-T55 TaxID=2748662 RepID=A0A8J7C7N5_9CYAN|nr:hybrid sensor histidine kinase/response regulator [Iningainema tapete]MBD2775889.1 hybrid sensor histidine kinase/response regulator [Iningainema tapete BLCC-T55]
MIDSTIYEQSYHYFLQEASSLLQVIEQELLSLREGYNINKFHTLMRATHTIKGAAASVGLETIKIVAHSLEDIFRGLCQPDKSIDPEVEALLFEGYECLRLPITALLTGEHHDTSVLDRTAAVFAQLQEKLGDCFGQEAYIPSSVELGFDLTQSIFEMGVSQRLAQLVLALDSGDTQQIASTLRTQAEVFFGLGESLNLPGFGAIATAAIAALDSHPEQAQTITATALEDFQAGQRAVLNGDRTQGGQPSLALQQLSELHSNSTEPVVDISSVATSSYEEANSLLELVWGQTAANSNDTDAAQKASASPPSPPTPSTHTVRVNVDHLEELNYFIGELLTNQNRLLLQNEQLWAAVRLLLVRQKQHQQLLNQLQEWSCRQFKPEQLHNLIHSIVEDAVQLGEATDAIEMFTRQSHETKEKQRRLLTNTRDALMEARMLPLGNLFDRFPRILQRLELIHKKQVRLELRGSEALVDKAVVEKLYDPLLHLLRNAFDHGIESPRVRQQRGKPEKGLIEICAYHQGRYLVVEVRDDGQGLDFEQIRALAVERQLISPAQARSLNETQLTDLLFEPGFSMASQVNDLSGRGIGLDVVRTHLHAMQGSVAVDSELYHGTIFKLQIPLSLSIGSVLLFQVGDRTYGLLKNAIKEILIPSTNQIHTWEGGKVLRWSNDGVNQLIPIYQLKSLNYFSLENQPQLSQNKQPNEQMQPIILIRCQDKILGLEVDRLLGDQELVIRPLGKMIVPPSYVYGGSILADGRLTLVLDGSALMEYLFNQQTNSTAQHTPLLLTSKQQPQLPQQARATLPASPLPQLKERPNKTILLVDDSITVRQTLALTLQKAGYQVLQAKDGYEAIEQLQQHTDINLVFCDIEMPRMNGFEFLKNRQHNPDLANIPVVMLTSRSSEKHRLIAFKLGATAYITKPYLEHMLLATLTDVLEKNTLRRDAWTKSQK